MKISRLVLASSLFGMMAACASVPKDAPEELQSADQSIKAANKADADDIAPKTMKASEKKLSQAVDLYKDSKKDHDEGKLADSKATALEAKKMADNAQALNSDVKSWDGGDLQAFVDDKNANRDLAAARGQLDQLRNQPAPVATTTNDAQFATQESAAFFSTNDSTVNDAMAPSLSHLVDMLNANKSMTVKLIGRADHRGSDTYNQQLSQSRAVAVSTYLQQKGVDQSRITIEARGSQDAVDVNGPGRLQLDRRVDAQVNTMAH